MIALFCFTSTRFLGIHIHVSLKDNRLEGRAVVGQLREWIDTIMRLQTL
jgi:hypothetical protein